MPAHAPPLRGPAEYPTGRLAAAFSAAVASAAAADGPAAAVDAAIDSLHQGLDAAFVAVFVLEHEHLWSVGVRGQAMFPDGLPLDQGVLGRAVRTRLPQLLIDVSSDPDFVDILRDTTSELAIPLLVDGQIVGVVNIETRRALPAGAGDEPQVARLAEALAGAAEALRNARTVDLSSLARLFVHVSSLRDPEAIADLAARTLARVLPIESAQVLLRNEAGQLANAVDWHASDENANLLTADVVETLLGRIDSSAVLELVDASSTPVPELAGTRARSVVLLPLRANGQEIGVLAGASRFARRLERTQGEAAALLAAHAAASLDAARALDKERRSALTDPLTGLLNRRGLEARLEQALEEARAGREPLSLVALDCDDFKDVNDRAGHEFGDALLHEIGDVLGAMELGSGCAARLGGDEFVVMLPGTDAAEAETIAGELGSALASGLDQAGFPLHLSAGVSTYPYDGASAAQLVRAADQALYEAKSRGKNCVVGFRDLLRVVGADVIAASAEQAAEPRQAVSLRTERSTLEDAISAANALWDESTVPGVLHRLGRSLTFVVGATGAQISLLDGDRLVDATQHALRHVDLGEDATYLLEDFPVTREVLTTGTPRALSFLDDDLDPAEAFVLRALKMSSCLMLPLKVRGGVWGLIELYDMRLRRFTSDEVSVAVFLAGQAGHKLESFTSIDTPLASLPLVRPSLDG